MADASAWVGVGLNTVASDRAEDAWERINEKPSSIVILRGKPKAALSAQTLRVEYSTMQSSAELQREAGTSSVQRVIVFGVRGHPTEPDSDIRRDDRFTLDGLQFRVVSVIVTLGEVQANCEAEG